MTIDKAAFEQAFGMDYGTVREGIKVDAEKYRQLANRNDLAEVLPIIEKWVGWYGLENLDKEMRLVVEAIRKLVGE